MKKDKCFSNIVLIASTLSFIENALFIANY